MTPVRDIWRLKLLPSSLHVVCIKVFPHLHFDRSSPLRFTFLFPLRAALFFTKVPLRNRYLQKDAFPIHTIVP